MIYNTLVPKEVSTEKDRLAWIKIQDNEKSSKSNIQVSTLFLSVSSPL